MKLDKDDGINLWQEYKYLGAILVLAEQKTKEIRARVIQARKCIACVNGILWSKERRKEEKLNIYNTLI